MTTFTPGTRVLVGRRLATVHHHGTHNGAPGYWITAGTGDPGVRGQLPSFAPEWTVRPAVLGDTVCATPWGSCFCGRVHVPARTLATLDCL